MGQPDGADLGRISCRSREDAEKIATAVVLLNKRDQLKDKHGPKDLLKKARVEFDLAQMSEYIISRAEARRRGENRPSLTEARDKRRDPGSVSQEWALVVQEFDDQKVKWAEPALKSEARLQSAIFVFNDALSPLIEALKAAKSSNIPLVEGKAEAATEKLSTAQGTLDPLSKALDRSREQLEGFIATVDKVLKPKPPETLDEVRGTRTTLDGEVQGLRAAQQAVKDQVAAINNLAKKEQKNLEQLVKEMVAAAVAWRQTEKVRQGSDVAASLLNGAVNAAQALDSEPMSALALQGLNWLIKGVCDGIKVAAGGIKAAMLKSAYDDVMGLVDKLEADDFIQAKLDLIKLGLSWVAEPLGLIPNVGAIVRTAVNVGVAAVLGTLKKAAAKQAKAAKAARGGTVEVDLTAEVDEAVDVIRESAPQLCQHDAGELRQSRQQPGGGNCGLPSGTADRSARTTAGSGHRQGRAPVRPGGQGADQTNRAGHPRRRRRPGRGVEVDGQHQVAGIR